MGSESQREELLRAYGIAAPGLEPAFDRIARLAVGAMRAPICVIAFGEASSPLVKGYSGPAEASAADMLPPPALYAELLSGRSDVLPNERAAGAAIRSEDGVAVGAVCTFARVPRTWPYHLLETLGDVAKLVETELAMRLMRHPDERIAQILESISDACVFLDRDYRYTFVNRKAGEIFGRRPRDLIAKHIWTEFPEGVGQPFDLAYRKAMQTQTFAQIEAYYAPWNRWFENRIYPSPTGLAIFFQDVTERRRAEQERGRLARIIEATPDIVIVCEAEGAVSYVNRAGRELLSLGPDADLAGLQIAALHAVPERVLLEGTALPTAVKQGSWSGESTLVSASGARIQVAEVVLWHECPAPDPGYFSVIACDISERKRVEAQRRREAELRDQAERMAHFGHWVWDIDENRVIWSAELFRIYGLDPGEFTASFEGYLALVHPQDRTRVQQTIEQALRDRRPFTFEERIIRPSGELRYLKSWGMLTAGSERGQNQLAGACLDVTELRVATQGLRRTEQWLEMALDCARVAVCEWDVRTRYARWSAGAAQVFGLGPDEFEVSFDAYLHHVHPDDRHALEEAIRVSVDTGAALELEHRVVAADGSIRWVAARARMIRDGDGQVTRLIGAVADVTGRRRAEDERRRLADELREAQKMEAIGRLAAGVAHDFNNHLTIIGSSADVLGRRIPPDAAAGGAIESIREAVERASALTRQLLLFGRGQARQLESLDLNEVVGEACKLLRRLLDARIELVLALSPELPKVRADRGQLEQVLLNLLVNARDAMPDGGLLTVTTRPEGEQVALVVRDSGVGMSADVQRHIFEPFYSTKSDAGGIGLGLATVYGIVSQLGGTIEVQSEPGAGSSFTIRLRRA